eukprot:scaffold15108_cov180-Amphora_coffeaeformis.AAC.56
MQYKIIVQDGMMQHGCRTNAVIDDPSSQSDNHLDEDMAKHGGMGPGISSHVNDGSWVRFCV